MTWKKRSMMGFTFKDADASFEHGKSKVSHEHHSTRSATRSTEGVGVRSSRTFDDSPSNDRKPHLGLPSRSISKNALSHDRLGLSEDEGVHLAHGRSRSSRHLGSVSKWSRPLATPEAKILSKVQSKFKVVRPSSSHSTKSKNSRSTLQSGHQEKLSDIAIEQHTYVNTSGAHELLPEISTSQDSKGYSRHLGQDHSDVSGGSTLKSNSTEQARTKMDFSWSQSVLAETSAVISRSREAAAQRPTSAGSSPGGSKSVAQQGPFRYEEVGVQSVSGPATASSVTTKESGTHEKQGPLLVLTKYEKILGLVPGPPPVDDGPRSSPARGVAPGVPISRSIDHGQKSASPMAKAASDAETVTRLDKSKASALRGSTSDAIVRNRALFERRSSPGSNMQIGAAAAQAGLFVSDLNGPGVSPISSCGRPSDSPRMLQAPRFLGRGEEATSQSSRSGTPLN